MFDTSTWKEYMLSELFEIKKGKRLTKSEQTPGDTIFIGATATNNGITAHIGQEAIHEANTISLTYNGSVGEAFYQDKPFWASDDVNVLYPLNFNMTPEIGLFFCMILRHEKQMWSYARKWNLEQMNRTMIKVPIKDGKVDYDFMQKYIESLNGDISDIPDYFLNEGYEKACWYLDHINQLAFEQEYAGRLADENIELNKKKWKNFRLRDIVDDIHNGVSYNASDLVTAADGDEYIAYVTRTDLNNGVSMRARIDEYVGLEKGNAITIGDTTSTIFFQSHDFITGPHMIVIRAKWLNVYTALFLISILNREKYRYPVFGRAYTKDLIGETEIPLPVKDSGFPDYEFMECYIKTLSFSGNIR